MKIGIFTEIRVHLTVPFFIKFLLIPKKDGAKHLFVKIGNNLENLSRTYNFDELWLTYKVFKSSSKMRAFNSPFFGAFNSPNYSQEENIVFE